MLVIIQARPSGQHIVDRCCIATRYGSRLKKWFRVHFFGTKNLRSRRHQQTPAVNSHLGACSADQGPFCWLTAFAAQLKTGEGNTYLLPGPMATCCLADEPCICTITAMNRLKCKAS
jgi:hypothetical protein